MFLSEKCSSCGDCLSHCRYMKLSRDEAVDAISCMRNGKWPSVLRQCVSCMACEESCKNQAHPFGLILQRQGEDKTEERFFEKAHLFEQAEMQKTAWVSRKDASHVISACRHFGSIKGTFEGELVEDAAVIHGGEVFCGLGYFHLGKLSPVVRTAGRVIETLSRLNLREIVFYHEDCYVLMATIAPLLGLSVPFKAVSWMEYLATRLTGLKERLRALNIKVAYQRPCASRFSPVKERYLDSILHLVGAERVSRRFDGYRALCCGAPIYSRDRSLAEKVIELNIKDAKEARADYLVFLCPVCQQTLSVPAEAKGLKAISITKLCQAAIGAVDL